MAPVVRPNIHPLLIDHVIDRIVKQRLLKPKDLLKMRQVCKQWNTQVTREYSKNMCLNLCRDDSKEEISLVQDVIAMIEDPNGNFPLFNSIIFNSSSHERDPDIFKLLTMFADTVKVLEDRGCRFNVLDKGKYQFPKLKRFVFVVQKSRMTDLPSNPSEILTHRIIRSSPVLEEVSISWAQTRIPKRNSKEYVAIELDLLQSIPLSLQKLSISKALRPNTTQLLSSFQWFQLTCLILDFRFGDSPMAAQQFCRLFENCKDTLTEFSVTRYQHAVKFPVFPRITKLTLGISANLVNRPTDHDLNNFNYHFPNVETLDILHLNSFPVLGALFPLDLNVPQVRTFKFPYLNTDDLTLFSSVHIFHYVETLHVTLVAYQENTMLRAVFHCMRGLEHLHLKFPKSPRLDATDYHVNLDFVLTGMRKRYKGESTDRIGYRGYAKFSPGISDLKKLKSLYIRAEDPSQMTITDVTGYLVLLEMQNLEVLKIDNFRLSAECLDALNFRFGKLKHTRGRQEFLEEMEALPEIIL